MSLRNASCTVQPGEVQRNTELANKMSNNNNSFKILQSSVERTDIEYDINERDEEETKSFSRADTMRSINPHKSYTHGTKRSISEGPGLLPDGVTYEQPIEVETQTSQALNKKPRITNNSVNNAIEIIEVEDDEETKSTINEIVYDDECMEVFPCDICYIEYETAIPVKYCCSAKICTECFTKIMKGDQRKCPFCSRSNFGIWWDSDCETESTQEEEAQDMDRYVAQNIPFLNVDPYVPWLSNDRPYVPYNIPYPNVVPYVPWISNDEPYVPYLVSDSEPDSESESDGVSNTLPPDDESETIGSSDTYTETDSDTERFGGQLF